MNTKSLGYIMWFALDKILLDLLHPSYETDEIDRWLSALRCLRDLAEWLGDREAQHAIEQLLDDVHEIAKEIPNPEGE